LPDASRLDRALGQRIPPSLLNYIPKSFTKELGHFCIFYLDQRTPASMEGFSVTESQLAALVDQFHTLHDESLGNQASTDFIAKFLTADNVNKHIRDTHAKATRTPTQVEADAKAASVRQERAAARETQNHQTEEDGPRLTPPLFARIPKSFTKELGLFCLYHLNLHTTPKKFYSWKTINQPIV
jgi:hypothetical protein